MTKRTRPPSYRPWTPAELAVVRQQYGTVPRAVLVERLGRTYSALQQIARRLGISYRQVERSHLPHQHFMGPESKARLRTMHAAGANDREIGRALGFDSQTICRRRRVDGLPSTYGTAGRRRAGVLGMQAAAQIHGRPLVELKIERLRTQARARGWPEDLAPRLMDVLDALWERGPMTRADVARIVPNGCSPRAWKNVFTALAQRGLVVTLPWTQGQGTTADEGRIYTLPLWLERKAQ